MTKEIPAQQIPGLKPWCCEYVKDGDSYGITLYGETPESVIENNCADLEGLKVLGELHSTIPVDPGDEDEILRRLGKS